MGAEAGDRPRRLLDDSGNDMGGLGMTETIERDVPGTLAASPGVTQARAELLKRFGAMGGVTARALDFSLVMPHFPREEVEQALLEMVEAGQIEAGRLADGTAVFHFPRC
jgi:hypothetical protein